MRDVDNLVFFECYYVGAPDGYYFLAQIYYFCAVRLGAVNRSANLGLGKSNRTKNHQTKQRIMKQNKQEYYKKNVEWLEAKSKEEGVNALERGVFYKVLQSGPASGKQPGMTNVVVCHYLGRTIDGKCFDTSLGGCPLAIRMRELIEGWIIALKQMHVGDKWEIYIPSELGYGKISQPGIPGGSALIFEVELIGVQ